MTFIGLLLGLAIEIIAGRSYLPVSRGNGNFSNIVVVAALIVLSSPVVYAQKTPTGTAWVKALGYPECIKLFNDTTEVVLEPNRGGRVLVYAMNGEDILFHHQRPGRWTFSEDDKASGIGAGRFDVGPLRLIPEHPTLSLGKWEAVITGERKAKLTSVVDPNLGIQLIREFELAEDSSHLRCKQTMINKRDYVQRLFYQSRTLVKGGGICIIPLSASSRLPHGYLSYDPAQSIIKYQPQEENITVTDRYVVVNLYKEKNPRKLIGIDSHEGWMAYLAQDNMLFVKRFPVYPERAYGCIGNFTVAVWYGKNQKCELEPLGPMETLQPGQSASFTEEWWLLPCQYPSLGQKVDIEAIEKLVETHIQFRISQINSCKKVKF